MRSRSSLGQNPLLSTSKVRWGADENRTYTEEGGLSPKPVASPEKVVRRAGVNPEEPQALRSILKTAIPTRAEQKMLERLNTSRAKNNESTQIAALAARKARNNTTRTPTTPTTIQHKGEVSVVNEPSQLENFATQLTGVPEATGKAITEFAGNVQSLIGNSFLGNLLPSDKSLPSGPEEVPKRVSRPNGTGNGNIKPHPTQVQGPRQEGYSWQQRVTPDQGGGRGGGRG